ncbi:MAG: HEAT repeat domain-containing protein [bacterium]
MKAYSDAIDSEIGRAEKTVNLLAKAIKAYQVYLPNNIMFKRAFEELTTALQDFFFDNEALTLVVKESELIYKNQVVYSNTDKMQSIAFKLYRDGIRLISFHSDIKEEEILAFIDVLSKVHEHDHIQDDLVTLLWEKDLHGITYYEVNEVDTTSCQVIFPQKDTSAEGGFQGLQDIDTSQLAQKMRWSSIESELESIRHTLSFTTDEISQMQQISLKDRTTSLHTLWQILLECLRIDRSVDCLTDLEPAIVALLDKATAQEGIVFINQILSSLKKICADIGGEANEIFLRILSSRTDLARSSIHAESISKADEDNKLDFIRYFLILEEKAIPLIVGIIDKCNGPIAWEICVSSLALIGSKYPDKLAALDNLTERQIEGILESLGRMTEEGAKLVAIKFIDQQSPRIKTKVAALLENLGCIEAIEALKILLSDSNPLVRQKAMISLCRNPANCSSDKILSLLFSNEFASLPNSSKFAVFISMRSLPPEVQKEVIQKILGKRSILGRKKLEDIQITAVKACAMLNREVAYDILNNVSSGVTKPVSKAISQVIERIENEKRTANRDRY